MERGKLISSAQPAPSLEMTPTGLQASLFRIFAFLIRRFPLKVTKRSGFPALIGAISLLPLIFAALLLAYNPEQDNVNGPVADRWQSNTVSWRLNATPASNVDTGGAAFGQSVQSVLTKS